jgi:hypothetical protein
MASNSSEKQNLIVTGTKPVHSITYCERHAGKGLVLTAPWLSREVGSVFIADSKGGLLVKAWLPQTVALSQNESFLPLSLDGWGKTSQWV